jgi:hypothetical protein
MRTPIKLLVAIGTEFVEEENLCRVTRVTDVDFDTLDTVTGIVQVRSLRAWETGFLNNVSGLTGLLKFREDTKKARVEHDATIPKV